MNNSRWLFLIHQLPNKPSNIRVSVWRKLQSLGAVGIKNSVYVLPNKATSWEDFEWLRKEISQSGGEASLFTGDAITEKENQEIIRNFQKARTKDYSAFIDTLRTFKDKLESSLKGGHIKAERIEKLKRQWSAYKLEWNTLTKIDFFKAPNKGIARSALSNCQNILNRVKTLSVKKIPVPPPPVTSKELKRLVWVTRKSLHVDRLASAWLVRRFIDSKAKFKFVTLPYSARPKEVRFDMSEGEFTHFGDWCTFETLIHRLRLNDPPLLQLAEIIHDIDLKDQKFSRTEAPGIALAIRGICLKYSDDALRLEAGISFFDGLYATLIEEVKQ